MDLVSSGEPAAGMCRLIAAVVVCEVGGEEIDVVGILRLGKALKEYGHDWNLERL